MENIKDILKPAQRTIETTIKHKEKWLQKGLTILPNAIVFDKKVSPQAKSLLLVLAGHAFVESDLFGEARDCRVSHDLLKEELGVSGPWISKYAKELINIGVLEVQRTGRSSFYIVSFSALESRVEDVVAHLKKVRTKLNQKREI